MSLTRVSVSSSRRFSGKGTQRHSYWYIKDHNGDVLHVTTTLNSALTIVEINKYELIPNV